MCSAPAVQPPGEGAGAGRSGRPGRPVSDRAAHQLLLQSLRFRCENSFLHNPPPKWTSASAERFSSTVPVNVFLVQNGMLIWYRGESVSQQWRGQTCAFLVLQAAAGAAPGGACPQACTCACAVAAQPPDRRHQGPAQAAGAAAEHRPAAVAIQQRRTDDSSSPRRVAGARGSRGSHRFGHSRFVS